MRSAICAHNQHVSCDGTVVRWIVYGKRGRHYDPCACICHDDTPTSTSEQ